MIRRISFSFFAVLLILISFGSCTNWNYKDTGVIDPYQYAQSSMYEFMSSDQANYSLTLALINKAGLKDLFEGKSSAYSKIMFIAPTDYALKAWLFRSGRITPQDVEGLDYYKVIQSKVTDEEAKKIIENYVFADLYYPYKFKESDSFQIFDEGERGDTFEGRKGGNLLTSINGNEIWFYNTVRPYSGYNNLKQYLAYGIEVRTMADLILISPNRLVKNGVLHANIHSFQIKID